MEKQPFVLQHEIEVAEQEAQQADNPMLSAYWQGKAIGMRIAIAVLGKDYIVC